MVLVMCRVWDLFTLTIHGVSITLSVETLAESLAYMYGFVHRNHCQNNLYAD